MIKPLRKRHRQIWTALALLLPACILLAWLAIPNYQSVTLLKAETAVLLPEVIKTVEKPGYQVAIRSNKERTAWQLSWKNKTVLTVPSAVIYQSPAGLSYEQGYKSFLPEKAVLVGRIETSGSYIFPLKLDSTGLSRLQFILYDFIHAQKIDSINF